MHLDSSISAVITGGASGLGEATARLLASHGVRVGLFDLNAERGEALAKELGGVFCLANVTSSEEIDAAFAKSRAAIGQERILVNCAGVGGSVKTVSRDRQTGEIKEYPLENFERIIQVNLIGTFRCITKSAAGMLTLDVLPEGDRGVIVNTASVAAEDGQIGQAAYTASKAGIVGLTLTVARDLASEAIRCNTILPGLFDTPLLQRLSEPVKAQLSAQVPHPKRLGMPEEYAKLAYAMITNEYFNGEDVRLDGAIRMAPR
jgi:NAD(P)-dependent dehydrogenase (short-subunit alcohol dehydrogenase family)